jgi:SAM-dependent methyltransferase
MIDNAFSKTWCQVFLRGMPETDTRREIEFVQRHMPRPEYSRLLDVACGNGRHADLLAAAGYEVLGVDRSPELIAEAARSSERARFEILDMRDVARLDGTFDGILSLWHSFGFYDAATNQALLEAWRAKLRPRGRAIIDVYNRAHTITRPGLERSERGGVSIETRRTWRGPRLSLELWYDGALGDRFDWHVYSPEELQAACHGAGFDVLLTCAWLDEGVPASPAHARMQLLLERR